MRWAESGGVRWLEADLPGAKAVFSTRSAGNAKEDLGPLAAALGLHEDRIATAHQVHGAELITHDTLRCDLSMHVRDKSQRKLDVPKADGHVVREPAAAALVFVADCLPVAVAGPGGVAILHCGWRGMAAGIVARGVDAVSGTHAAIGPGIGPCCYEVGDEVLGAFAGLGEGIASGRMLDLPEVACRLLREAGVEEIESTRLCTCCEEESFFSHRRDAGPGRQAGVVWLEKTGG
jgi:polyphenol oxidase